MSSRLVSLLRRLADFTLLLKDEIWQRLIFGFEIKA